MATLNLLDPNDSQQRDAWDAYVDKAKNGTVFHTTAWMDVIHRGLGLEPRYLYLEGAGGLIEGLVPLFRAGSIFSKPRWLNLPQSIPSHVLAQGPKDSDTLLGLIAKSAMEENTQVVCLRTTDNYSPLSSPPGKFP